MFVSEDYGVQVMPRVGIRIFAAVPVAEPAVVRALEAVQRELRQAGGRVRWTAAHQFHFTLRFLGEVPAERAALAERALEQGARGTAPFTLEVAGLGAFPRPEAARVLWAGCHAGRAALEQLAARVESAMQGEGFPPEPRRFSPHLTLGRVADGGLDPKLAEAVRREARRPFGTLSVEKVVLYRSDLRPSGPVYTSLAEFALTGEKQDL